MKFLFFPLQNKWSIKLNHENVEAFIFKLATFKLVLTPNPLGQQFKLMESVNADLLESSYD